MGRSSPLLCGGFFYGANKGPQCGKGVFPVTNCEPDVALDPGCHWNKGYTGECCGECKTGDNRNTKTSPHHADQHPEILHLEADARCELVACVS